MKTENITKMMKALQNKPEGATHISDDGSCFYKDVTEQGYLFTSAETKWLQNYSKPDAVIYPISDLNVNTPLNPINNFLAKHWFDKGPIKHLCMTEKCRAALYVEPSSEKTINVNENGVFFTGILIKDLSGEHSHIGIDDKVFTITPHGIFEITLWDMAVQKANDIVDDQISHINKIMEKAQSVVGDSTEMNRQYEGGERKVRCSIAGGFVTGEYKQVKAVQTLILENENLKIQMSKLRGVLNESDS